MHGDDVASAGVQVTAEMISKANEILLEIIKIHLDEERENNRIKAMSDSDIALHGGEVTLRNLRQGGEITMLPCFEKADYKELANRVKMLDIPIAAVQEKGKANTLSVFFNTKDKTMLNSILKDMKAQKLKQASQTEKMITIEKTMVEGFQIYCSDHDIPVCFMEAKDGVKCIFDVAYQQQIEKALENYRKMQEELTKISVEIEKEKGKSKFIITDMNTAKKITMNFCTKARLEQMLCEQMGFAPFKAAEASNVLAERLSEEQKTYFYCGSRTAEQMDYFEKDITFDDDNILTENYSFAKLKFRNDNSSRLTITDKYGNFVVLSGASINRHDVERNIKSYLKVTDNETIAALMKKAERLGFAEKTYQRSFKEYTIERETRDCFNVKGGNTLLRLDMSDKDTVIKQLTDVFGMSSSKAERILAKAQKQSVSLNTLQRVKAKLPRPRNTLDHKTRDRGSRK